MKNYIAKKIIFLSILLFLTNFSLSNASSNGIDVNLEVGGCNNNSICEAGQEDMFSCPADCTPKPNTGGSLIANYFDNFTVEVSYNSAIIRWKSNIPTISNLKWGNNSDYRDGTIKNINFLLDHKIEINNLKDGTLYYFNITSENYFGVANSLENQVFRTLSLPDITPPSNPTNVNASSDSSGITISWKNPTEEDFDYVRIMRNDNRYHSNPFIGHLVYEGSGKYFTDSKVIALHKYFYSLFSRDRAGNYSSGSLISITHNPKGLDNWGKELAPAEKLESLANLFIVTQGSSIYDFYPDTVFNLSGDEPIYIKTNYSSIIENDDMWLDIRDSEEGIIGQYFFSRTKNENGFINVIIPSFENSGHYKITIYKYRNGVINIINYGSFNITKVAGGNNIKTPYIVWISLLLLLFILILILMILRKIFKRFSEKKQ